MVLVNALYKVTQSFPVSEVYGLTSQLRRSAVSIPSNIAEGYGRRTTGEYKRFLQIAVASLFELQTQIEIAFNIEYINKEVFDQVNEKTTELDRMLSSLINKITNKKVN